MTQDQVGGLIGHTWDLTLDLLDARQLPEARKLLGLLATFADAPIPYQLLLIPAELASSPVFEGITGARLWQLLTALSDYGLTDLDPSGESWAPTPMMHLHRLVRDASRPHPWTDTRVAYLELATRVLARATNEVGLPEDPPTWLTWQLLAPHAVYVFESIESEPSFPDEVAKTAASTAHMAARYQAALGTHAQAEAWYQGVLAARLRLLGADHPDTLATRQQIAWEMAQQGKDAAAEAEFRAVLADRLRVLGADHPDTLAIRYQIAWEMAVRGDHPGAEAEFRAVLADRLRVLGADHPDTLATRHQVAHEVASRGDHAGAEAEYRDVLAVMLRKLGPDNPSMLATRHQIAWEMAARGNHAGAEAEYRDVLATKQRVLGADHPSTLATHHQVALEMAALKDYAEANAEFRYVLSAKLRVLGPDHPDTLVTIQCIEFLERREKGTDPPERVLS
jgi:Tetratricopeptide repeat